MSKLKILTACISCAAILVMLLPASAGGIPVSLSELEVSAKAAVLIDASDGSTGECCRVVYEKNSRERLPMASTTKIMTAIVALENCDLERVVSVPEAAVGVEGSSVYLYSGEKISTNDLIYALMLESANDAAVAIAIETAGSIEAFAELMNKKAEELGLVDTHFTNPHGLDDENHYTSAYDLAILTAYAMKNPTFKEVVATYRRVIPLLDKDGSRLLLNHNKLLRQYDGAVGVKTGFTKTSGRCLVSCAERDGMCLVAVTLNAPEDWADHRKMLDMGFDFYERVELLSSGGEERQISCVGGVCESVKVANRNTVSAVLPRGDHDITKRIEMRRFCYAPVSEGEVVGRVSYYEGDKLIGEDALVTLSGVEAAPKKGFWDFILSLFR